MATTQYSNMIREYQELIRREDRRTGRQDDFEGRDPFDKATDHDDDGETDDFALYRLGVK
jgi:hypothetical protein